MLNSPGLTERVEVLADVDAHGVGESRVRQQVPFLELHADAKVVDGERVVPQVLATDNPGIERSAHPVRVAAMKRLLLRIRSAVEAQSDLSVARKTARRVCFCYSLQRDPSGVAQVLRLFRMSSGLSGAA